MKDFTRDPVALQALEADPLTKDETQPAATVAALVRADERLHELVRADHAAGLDPARHRGSGDGVQGQRVLLRARRIRRQDAEALRGPLPRPAERHRQGGGDKGHHRLDRGTAAAPSRRSGGAARRRRRRAVLSGRCRPSSVIEGEGRRTSGSGRCTISVSAADRGNRDDDDGSDCVEGRELRRARAGSGSSTGRGGPPARRGRWSRSATALNAHSGQYLWAAEQLAAAASPSMRSTCAAAASPTASAISSSGVEYCTADLGGLIRIAKQRAARPAALPARPQRRRRVSCIYTLDHQAELDGLICEDFAFRVSAPASRWRR